MESFKDEDFRWEGQGRYALPFEYASFMLSKSNKQHSAMPPGYGRIIKRYTRLTRGNSYGGFPRDILFDRIRGFWNAAVPSDS